MQLWLVLVVACLLASAHAQEDLVSLIEALYGEDGNKAPPSGGSSEPNLNPVKPIPGTGTCTCVPYYLCNNRGIIRDGVGFINISFAKTIKDGECSNSIELCCDEDNKVVDPIIPTFPPPIDTTTGGGGIGGGSGTRFGSTGSGSTGPIAGGGTSQYHTRGCGYRNPEGVDFRITGDKEGESQFGEFPWMVAVLIEKPVNISTIVKNINVYQCGGALIHPKVVLTAAHCVSGKVRGKVLKVRAGEWNTQIESEVFPHQDRDVVKVIVHLNFHDGALFNDVALLVLNSSVNLQENVDLVCLPPKDFVPDQKQCFVSGWGHDVYGGKYQFILKKVELPLVQHPKCQDSLRNTLLGVYYELHRSFICAGGVSGKGTCKGDGGSPLVCPIPGQVGRYYQAGIVSWGIGCGENGIPGVYANVAHLRPWIDEQMQYERFDTKNYSY